MARNRYWRKVEAEHRKYQVRMEDPQSIWIVLKCDDPDPDSGNPGFRSRRMVQPATYAECDCYTEVFKDDVRGEGSFRIVTEETWKRYQRRFGASLLRRAYNLPADASVSYFSWWAA
jgi:hypothetical protein